MFRLLRRLQPSPAPLAVLYWAALLAVVAVALLTLFALADRFLPGAGQF
ncbi:MAG TPA: hypothetical protein VKA30_12475 [Actinomycetota bacterium]|nr:hypothetical protein [Actinomycetota bacterium]